MKVFLGSFIICGLIAASVIVSAATKQWWERGNFYQIYPRSFKDSDGDGIGDIKGITEKMPYLKEIGMTGVWLSPIFKSPMKDFGYDISNYTDVHWEYGTLTDVDNLIKVCKRLGVKLILDFVPNHTSNQHAWLIKSEAGDEYYKDFYVWSPGKVNNETGEVEKSGKFPEFSGIRVPGHVYSNFFPNIKISTKSVFFELNKLIMYQSFTLYYLSI